MTGSSKEMTKAKRAPKIPGAISGDYLKRSAPVWRRGWRRPE